MLRKTDRITVRKTGFSPARSILVVVRGRFVMTDVGIVGTHVSPRGTVIALVGDAHGDTTDFGLSSRMPSRATLKDAVVLPQRLLKSVER